MLRFHAALADLMVPVSSITPDPRNANNGDVDELIASLLTNGCYRPIYVHAASQQITAGHTLYAALCELGAQMVPVLWVDGDDLSHLRIMVTDNQIAALAKMDRALLLDLLEDIRSQSPLTGTGFDDTYVDDLRESIVNEAPLKLGEQLAHTITCPECGHSWRRS